MSTTRGQWVWSSPVSPEQLPVGLELGRGARLWVDLNDVTSPIRLEAEELPSLARCSAVYPGGWTSEVLRTAPLGGNLDTAGLPTLTPRWQRLTLVSAVEQYSPLDYESALLTIDLALAWHGVDFPRRATALAQLVDGIIADLHWAAYDGKLPPTAAAKVAQAVALLLDAPDTDPDVKERLTAIQDRAETAAAAVDDTEWEFVLDLWSDELARAASMGTTDVEGLPPLVLDPRWLPPRLLPWRGPHWDGIRLSREGDGLRLDLELRLGEVSWSAEAAALRTLAVDTDTGEQLASASFTPAPSAADAVNVEWDEHAPEGMTAFLDLPPQQWRRAAVSVIAREPGAPTGTALDASRAGLMRVRVERLLLAAWATARLADATPDPALTRRSQEYLLTAQLVGDAVPAGTHTTHGPGAALDVVLDRAEEPGGWPSGPSSPAVQEPLLAELLYGMDLDDLHTQAIQES